jgi:hypothetical protein
MTEEGPKQNQFGRRGDAAQLLQMASGSVPGQTMHPTTLAKVQSRMAEEAAAHDTGEAAAFCEEVIAWLNAEWNARGFSPEQRIFSVALATINLRQHFPEERGGKDVFDRVSKAAWSYFQHATDGRAAAPDRT